MIKCELANTSMEGNADQVLSELALLIHVVVREIHPKAGLTYTELLGKITGNSSIYILTDSGMAPEEAMGVLGMDPDTFDKESTAKANGDGN